MKEQLKVDEPLRVYLRVLLNFYFGIFFFSSLLSPSLTFCSQLDFLLETSTVAFLSLSRSEFHISR